MVSRLHPILRAMVEFVFHVGLPEPVAPAIELNDAEWIEQIKILDNALLPNNNKKNEVEDEAAPNTGSLSLSVATSSSSSTISSFDRTLTSSNSQSSSDLSLLTSASSFPSGLGDQSDKEDSVGHGDTQSNLDGQNGNSGEQDGSHDPKSQKEEGKGDLGHGGGNRNEIGSSPNQEELPSQDRSPAQIAGSDNGGNGKHVGNNKVEVPDNSSESGSLDSDQSDWNSREDEILDGALPDPRHCSRLIRRVNEVLKEAFDDLVIFRDPKTVTKNQMVETLLRHFPETSVQRLLIDQDVFDRITPTQLAKIKIKIDTFANEFLGLIAESAPGALVPSSPAVDALIATPTLVLDGLVHYLVRLLSGQELANFIFAPGVGDGGVALDSKASSFLELCVLEFNPELCSWLMEAVERVGQAYDCDVRFDSSKAEFLKILPQIGCSVPEFPRFEEFSGALSDSFVQVLVDRFLTADFDFVIETLYRQLIRHNFGAAQDFPEFFSGYGSVLETDEETSFGTFDEIPPFPEIVHMIMLCKRPFIEIVGRRFSLEKLETIQLRPDVAESAADKVYSEIFKLVVEKEAGLDIAIKVVEAAIENQMMKWIVSKASQYVEGGLEFPSELSEFILGLAGRAIKEADYLREASHEPPRVVRRRHYVDFPGISGSVLRTFQWGSFLAADDR